MRASGSAYVSGALTFQMKGGVFLHTNEDYLDSLLHNVTDKLNAMDEDFEQNKQMSDPYMSKKNLPPKTMKALEIVKENQFLREFERELTQDDPEGFLASYEAELENEAQEFSRTKESQSLENADGYMDQIGDLVREAQPDAMQPETLFASAPQPEESEMSDDTDFVDTISEPVELPEGMEQLGSLFENISTEPETSLGEAVGLDDPFAGMPPMDMDELGLLSEDDEERILPEDGEDAMSDEDIMKLLGEESEDEALADIGKMLEADEQSISLSDLGSDPESMSYAADVVENQKQEQAATPKQKKNGFLAKLLDLLFGEDEDDEDAAAAAAEVQKDVESLGDISDENMEILRAMSGDRLAEPESDGAKGKKRKKKKDKKDKKDKNKDEKAAKPKKEKKPRREKKEKKPKPVTPREKPLPRGPVVMIWVVALSIFALIWVGGSLLSKNNAVLEAQRSFDHGNYVDSYEKLAGMKIGASDQELYERASVLASVQTELDAYYSMMEVRKFDLALDCLVRALGRSDLNMAKAEEWTVTIQMDTLVTEITKQLKDQFDVTPERAKELYEISDRDEYSLAIDEVLGQLGLK